MRTYAELMKRRTALARTWEDLLAGGHPVGPPAAQDGAVLASWRRSAVHVSPDVAPARAGPGPAGPAGARRLAGAASRPAAAAASPAGGGPAAALAAPRGTVAARPAVRRRPGQHRHPQGRGVPPAHRPRRPGGLASLPPAAGGGQRPAARPRRTGPRRALHSGGRRYRPAATGLAVPRRLRVAQLPRCRAPDGGARQPRRHGRRTLADLHPYDEALAEHLVALLDPGDLRGSGAWARLQRARG